MGLESIFDFISFIIENISNIFSYMITLFVLMFDTVRVLPGLFSFIPEVISTLLFAGLTVVIIAHFVHWEN